MLNFKWIYIGFVVSVGWIESPVRIAYADTDLTDSVVRVRSFLCRTPDISRAGSGVLVKNEGRIYVLTSEHVVFHSEKSEFCHEIEKPGQFKYSVRFLTANWGNGLALLKAPDHIESESITVLSLKTLKEEIPAQGEKVTLAGYVLQEDDQLMSEGKVLVSRSQRHLFAEVQSVIELEQAHVEFGMSGGLAFSSRKKEWLGLISHQVIELLPGRPSEVRAHQTSQHSRVNRPLLISSQTILNWLKLYFDLKEDYRPLFTLNASDQALGKERVCLGELQFEIKSLIRGTDIPESRFRGGNDGIGVGGGASSGSSSWIEIALDRERSIEPFSVEQGEAFPQNARLLNWSESVLEKIRRGNQVEIPFLIQGDQLVPFQSLAEFFREILLHEKDPVTLLAPRVGQFETTSKIGRLSEKGRQIVEFSEKLLKELESHPETSRVGLKEFFNRCLEIGTLLESDNWKRMTTTRMKDLKEDEFWRDAFDLNYENSVELFALIVQSQELLLQIKL